MNYLYIDFPRYKNGDRDLSSLKKSDTLEVRLCELGWDSIVVLFRELEKLNLKIDLTFKKTNDAYGSIQIFSFS